MILGLDIGTIRVGVASLLENERVPQPLGAFVRAGDSAVQKILAIITEQKITRVVVGYPLAENGSRNTQCDDIDTFCRRLQRRATIEIIKVDESDSSLEAHQFLNKRKKVAKLDLRSKGSIDAMAACIILERYVQSRL